MSQQNFRLFHHIFIRLNRHHEYLPLPSYHCIVIMNILPYPVLNPTLDMFLNQMIAHQVICHCSSAKSCQGCGKKTSDMRANYEEQQTELKGMVKTFLEWGPSTECNFVDQIVR